MKTSAKWSVLVSILLVVSLFLTACGGGGTKSSGSKSSGSNGNNQLADKQELNFVSTQDIPTLNSLLATDTTSHLMLDMLKSGLYTYYDEKPVPDMSDGQPEISKDGKTYTFKIRQDAKWSNGDPVKAEDFVFAWQKLIDPKTGSQYADMPAVANIKNAAKILDKNSDLYGKVDQLGAKAKDDKTLVVTLEKPTPYFLGLMAFSNFFPINKKFYEEQGKDYALEPDKLLYNGAYKLEKWQHGTGWTLAKNKDYWDAKNITIDKVNYKVVKDQGTKVNLYKTDKIQAASINADYIPQYKGKPELQIIPGNCVFNLKLNEKTIPAFKNKKVRQAVAMSIDRENFVNVLLGDGSKAANYWIPSDWAFSPDGKDFRDAAPDGYLKGNKDDAKKLWEEAKKELGIKELKMEYLTTDSDQSVKYAEYFAHQIEQGLPGVKISLNKQPWNQYLDLENNGKYQIAGGSGWCPDYQDPTTFLDLLKTGHSFNTMDWNNKEYNKLMEEASKLGTQPAERWKKLQEAEKVLIEDAGIVTLYQNGGAELVKPYIKGLKFPLNGPGTDWRHAKVTKH
ncbi:peptide ABC transporter substrate-binding protein [Camelliibacillus cellulosilyticus]|uniref:Peptide ABC transporter substrate-binding protein n=1 Tax=Camelliibacillus cellulosilyticus TaxID=2174486 RepID=A0ABV9GQ39_9BACL